MRYKCGTVRVGSRKDWPMANSELWCEVTRVSVREAAVDENRWPENYIRLRTPYQWKFCEWCQLIDCFTFLEQPCSLANSADTLSILVLTVVPKCTLAASRAALGEWRWVCRRDGQIDGRTPDRYIMLSARRGQHNSWSDRAQRVDFYLLTGCRA